MLLSSHVLSEVQRVASRIGVVSHGRVIAVERLDELRARSLHHVEAQVAGHVAATAFDALPGLRDVRMEDGVLRCDAPQSALDALLKEVARHDLVDFSCTEAELEETFMAFYSRGGGDAA